MPIDYNRMMEWGRPTFRKIQKRIDYYIYNHIYISYLMEGDEDENIPTNWFETLNPNDPNENIDEDKVEEVISKIIDNTIDSDAYENYECFYDECLSDELNAHGYLLQYILYSGRKEYGDDYIVPDDAMSYISDACILYTSRWLNDNKKILIKWLVDYRKEDFEREEEDRVAGVI